MRRQVPTLKQASPLRVSPERRLVLDCRRHEIACVWWLERTRIGSARLATSRRPAFRLPTPRFSAPRFSLVHSGAEWPCHQLSGSPIARQLALKYATLFIYRHFEPDDRWISRGGQVRRLLRALSPLSLENTGFREGSASLRRSDPPPEFI